MPPEGGEAGESSNTSDGEGSDQSSHRSDEEVDPILMAAEPAASPGATPPVSDTELDAAALDLDKVDEPVAPLVAAAEPLPLDVVAVAVAAAKPDFALGVDQAEHAPSGRSKCMVCNLATPFKSVRLRYWTANSAHKFLHVGCFGGLPLPTRAHSIACLEHQRAWLVGPDDTDISDAIDVALAL